MSIDRSGISRVTLFVVIVTFLVVMMLGGDLIAQSAEQTTQKPAQPTATAGGPPPDRALVDPVTGKPISPTVAAGRTTQGPKALGQTSVAPTPDAKGSAPGSVAGMPTHVKSSGRVGPGGKIVSQGPSSPDGSAKVLDPAIERLGPGGTAVRTSTLGPFGPGATADQASTSQRLGPDAVQPSQPAKKGTQQQPPAKPSTGSGTVAKEPAAKTGAFVFLDPATGEITEPTDAQLRELEQQHRAASVAPGQVIVEERPGGVGGGLEADVPASLFPVVTASIGADGKVTLKERQAQAPTNAAVSPGQRQDAEQVLSEAAQRLGPAGDRDLAFSLSASDAIVTIVTLDAAGEGFNDATAVAPVFGNRGTTLGAQRLNVFRAAAEHWGGILRSTVPIRVDARMDPQFCTATSAVLGSAGPSTVHRDYTGAPLAATWYVQALANSRFGADLNTLSDISATFNSDIDNASCLGATRWWYGIGAPAPAGTIDFYTVVLHEIGHGIGVLSLVNLGTGEKFLGFDDAYERWLWDFTVGGWPALTNAQRLASAVNTGQVIFWGPRATEASRGLSSAGNNSGYPRVFAPNPVQGGSSISHFDTVLTPNELMEPAITAPPGPYAYLTSGLLQDIGWQLLSNAVFDFSGAGTWTWNPVDGWFSPTSADPSNLEPWNGNFVGVYNGTWLWNETTSSWTLLTSASPSALKACGNNLLWASAVHGTWSYNLSTGWDQLSNGTPESLECFGGDVAWEGAAGTWLYDFSTAGGPGTGGWRQITGVNPVGILPCGSKLVWWRAGDTWYYDNAAGWTLLTSVGPETTACYRGLLAWEGPAGPGTWLYNFTTLSWQQISVGNPDQMLPWGPNLVWENTALGTWIWDGAAWAQITSVGPTLIDVVGSELIWSWPGGTWVWSGGGGGAGWTNITAAVPTEIVGTGAVHPGR